MKNKKTKEQKKDIQDSNTPEPNWLYDNPSDITEPYKGGTHQTGFPARGGG